MAMAMGMIYHYTTLKAFKGMLHTPTEEEFEIAECNKDVDWAYYLEFHASDIRMMNDKRENALISDVLRDFPGIMRGAVYLTDNADKVYSISFCKQKDYIPMWNIYANNGDDIGICLGFKTDKLEESVNRITKGLTNKPGTIKYGVCKYLTEKGIKRKVGKYRNELRRLSKELELEKDMSPSMDKLWQLKTESVFCKLNDFEYEKESRLIGFIPFESLIKKGRYAITTYTVIKVPLSLLKEIVISPVAPNSDIIRIGIIELLKNKGYDKVQSLGLMPDLHPIIEINIELSKLELI